MTAAATRKRIPKPKPDNARILSVLETCIELRISKQTFFELLARGALRTLKIGRRRFMTPSAIADFLEQAERDAAA